MALFSQNMLELALALTEDDPDYADFVFKFVEHFFWIAAAVDPIGDHPDEMWDDEDGFFYDVLRRPDGTGERLKVRSLVGLLPLCATTVISADVLERAPRADARASAPTCTATATCSPTSPTRSSPASRAAGCCRSSTRTSCGGSCTRMLDEERFLGPHGIRSISRIHLDEPYEVVVEGNTYRVQYEPAESTTGMFGGNSNWRGPVWFPVNLLIVRALLQHYRYYGDDFTIECPTGSGNQMTLFEVAQEIAGRLIGTFLRGRTARRPVYGGTEMFQNDPHWRDLILFYEYFHGDNGAGLGASHQTGWTGLVAPLIQLFGHLDAESVLEPDDRAAGPAVPAGHGRVDRPTSRRPARREASTREAAGEPARPRDLHVGLAGRPVGARRPPGHAGRRPRRGVGRRRRPGVDAVWLMGVWERSPAGAAIARAAPGDGRSPARAPCPTSPTTTSSGRRTASATTRVDDRLGGDAGLAAARAALGGARRRPRPRLRAQPRRARPPVGARAPGVLRARHGRRPRARSRRLPRRRRRRHRPRPRSVLPGLARGAAARRLAAGDAGRRRGGGRVDRRALRRRALRHGDADARRRLRAHVGRAGGRRRRRPTAAAATGRR